MHAGAENQIRESIDHLFRYYAGQMVSVLSRIFGLEKLDMIEDAVQDALVTALRKWPYSGMPDNPTAWVIQVSKNRILDNLRANKKFVSTEEHLEDVENAIILQVAEGNAYFAGEMSEDQLRMIFACCHPSIPPDAQVALTLKIVGGFSVGEIARAYLASEDSVAKMLTRAKAKLRSGDVSLEIPVRSELKNRMDAVTKVLYLMFNEGYSASGGEELIRRDLCLESIRLSELLAAHPITSSPTVDALAALLLFQASRLDSRCREDGELMLLSEQDRTLWDKKMIGRALHHFRLSASGDELSDYHLEAEIAACHATAMSYEDTRWEQILNCYELLQQRKFSPVVELNRIIALAKIEGGETGLLELKKFEKDQSLKDYNLFHITLATFLSETGDYAKALDSYSKAIALTQNEIVLRFLCKRMDLLKLKIDRRRESSKTTPGNDLEH
jgi:RNA polymerase sigma factor (sigma-70 family)